MHSAPAGADKRVTLSEDGSHVFSLSDFDFTDADGDSLAAVVVTTLPSAGTLLLNGAAVSAGQSVDVAEIVSGHLAFVPAANANGTDYSSFTFQVQDDGGTAGGGE